MPGKKLAGQDFGLPPHLFWTVAVLEPSSHFFIVQFSTRWSWSPSDKALLDPFQSSPSRDLQTSPCFQESLSDCLFKILWATISPSFRGDVINDGKTQNISAPASRRHFLSHSFLVDEAWFWKWPENNTSDKHKWDWWKYRVSAPNSRHLVDFY